MPDYTCDKCGSALMPNHHFAMTEREWEELGHKSDGRLGYYFVCTYPVGCANPNKKQ